MSRYKVAEALHPFESAKFGDDYLRLEPGAAIIVFPEESREGWRRGALVNPRCHSEWLAEGWFPENYIAYVPIRQLGYKLVKADCAFDAAGYGAEYMSLSPDCFIRTRGEMKGGWMWGECVHLHGNAEIVVKGWFPANFISPVSEASASLAAAVRDALASPCVDEARVTATSAAAACPMATGQPGYKLVTAYNAFNAAEFGAEYMSLWPGDPILIPEGQRGDWMWGERVNIHGNAEINAEGWFPANCISSLRYARARREEVAVLQPCHPQLEGGSDVTMPGTRCCTNYIGETGYGKGPHEKWEDSQSRYSDDRIAGTMTQTGTLCCTNYDSEPHWNDNGESDEVCGRHQHNRFALEKNKVVEIIIAYGIDALSPLSLRRLVDLGLHIDKIRLFVFNRPWPVVKTGWMQRRRLQVNVVKKLYDHLPQEALGIVTLRRDDRELVNGALNADGWAPSNRRLIQFQQQYESQRCDLSAPTNGPEDTCYAILFSKSRPVLAETVKAFRSPDFSLLSLASQMLRGGYNVLAFGSHTLEWEVALVRYMNSLAPPPVADCGAEGTRHWELRNERLQGYVEKWRCLGDAPVTEEIRPPKPTRTPPEPRQ